MVMATEASRSRISNKARVRCLYTKNIGVQIQFKNSCSMNSFRGVGRVVSDITSGSSSVIQTLYDAYPIMQYSAVHTGPKALLGGRHEGFLIFWKRENNLSKYCCMSTVWSHYEGALANQSTCMLLCLAGSLILLPKIQTKLHISFS